MKRTPPLDLRWEPREPPLVPEAVLAVGPAAIRLGRRLLRLDAERLMSLRVAASPTSGTGNRTKLIAVLGPAETLPWVNGAIYFGRVPDAPALYLPTTQGSRLPASLLDEAVQRRASACPPPVAVLPDGPRLISLAAARPLAPDRLHAWLEFHP